MHEGACYTQLVAWLHPEGLTCPDCHCADHLLIHRRNREPVIDYRCGHCGRVFNAFTGTALQGIHYRCSMIVLILRGIAQGVPTAQLARELNCDRGNLLALRHRLQELAFGLRRRLPLDDPVVEADEMYQNAGEKGVPHLDPNDPPRRRANQVPGHGNWDNDRPPVCGVVGRTSGQLRLRVEHRADGPTLQQDVQHTTWPKTTVNTDEWGSYAGLPALGRGHVTVCHAAGEWAAGRRWRRDSRGAYQHAGRDLDRAADLLGTIPRSEQGLFASVRGDLRVGLQPEAGGGGVHCGRCWGWRPGERRDRLWPAYRDPIT